MRVGLALALLLLAAVPAAQAATPLPPPRLTEERAVEIALDEDGVAAWVSRYPADSLVTDAEYDDEYRDWTVKAWSGPAGQIVLARVDDLTGLVEDAWTGPQVAWPMARGHEGAFGGKRLNSLPVWLGFCAVFVLGLADLRRLRSIRNLDLLVLVSLSVSLWFFNEGRIFTSVPLVYPVLLYLLGRTLWIGIRDRAPTASRPVWPIWVLAAATVFLGGFRMGLDFADSNVIDVGYSGVIGAHRIANGQAPYGHFPQESGRPCGPPDRNGRIVLRIQENGRCEGQNGHGDTYGPVAYEAYLPGYAIFGWKGKGDELPAAHFTSILFDLVAIAGLVLVGLRYGGRRLAATLAFAWTAFPFTQYVASSSSNDAIQPALLIFGFWLASSPWARGSFAALASWAKFAPLVVAPLWATYPGAAPSANGVLRPGLRAGHAGGVLGAAARVRPDRRGRNVLGPRHRSSDRPRVAVLALGLAAVPRGPARPARRPVGATGAAGGGSGGARVRSPTQVAAAAGRADGGAADRLRDRAHPLVLPLRGLVLPVRRVRHPRPRTRPRAARKSRPRWGEGDALVRASPSWR